MDKSEDLPA